MDVQTQHNSEVLFVVPRFHTNLIGWFQGLTKLGISFQILVQTYGKSENHIFYHPEKIDPNTDYFRIPFWGGIKFKKYFTLLKHIRRLQPRLIFFRFELNLTSLVFLINILLSRKAYVIYLQWPLSGLRLSKGIIRKIMLSVLRAPIVTPVLSQSDSWIGMEQPDKHCRGVFFIPFGVPIRDSESELSSFSTKAGGLKFLTIGKFQRRKRHLETIENFLSNSNFCNTEATLEIIGEVSSSEHFAVLREIKDLIASKNLEEKILISTNIEHDKVLAKLNNCDIFVLMSDSEPASVSNLEAMSFGKPVIIKSGNGTANYLNHERGGFIVSTPTEFNQRLNYFFDHPDFIATCKSENLSSVKLLMDPFSVASKLMRIGSHGINSHC